MDSSPLPWSFAPRSEAAVQTDPFEEEFFIGPSDDELGDGHVASLVRESIQNAIDARTGSEPVRVFKAEVARGSAGGDYDAALHDVWSVMNQLHKRA